MTAPAPILPSRTNLGRTRIPGGTWHGHGDELAGGAPDGVKLRGSLVQVVQHVIERALLVWSWVECFDGGDGC
jgi:hypothetical protein